MYYLTTYGSKYVINTSQKFNEVSSCLTKCQIFPSVAMHCRLPKSKNSSSVRCVTKFPTLARCARCHGLAKLPSSSNLRCVTKCSGLSWSKSSTSVRCVTRFPSLANQLTVLEPSVTNLHLIAKLGQKHTILFAGG